MDENLDDKLALDQVLESLTESERQQVLALSEDSSYIEPRVLSHMTEQ